MTGVELASPEKLQQLQQQAGELPEDNEGRLSAGRLDWVSSHGIPKDGDEDPSAVRSPSARGRGKGPSLLGDDQDADSTAIDEHRAALQQWRREFGAEENLPNDTAENAGAEASQQQDAENEMHDADEVMVNMELDDEFGDDAEGLEQVAAGIAEGGEDVISELGINVPELLNKHTVGGVVSVFNSAAQRKQLLSVRANLRHIEDVRQDVRDKQRIASDAVGAAKIAANDCHSLQKETGEMQQQIDDLNAKDRYGNLDKIKTLEQRVQNNQQRIVQQKEKAQQEQMVAELAERELGLAEAELYRVSLEEDKLKLDEERITQEQRILADYRNEKATENSLRKERRRRRQETKLSAQFEEQQRMLSTAVQQAKHGQQRARERLRESKMMSESEEVKLSEFYQEKREKRKGALLNLKKNMDSIADSIKSRNAARLERAKEDEVRRAAEAKKILAAGGNPYAVWRQREFDKRLEQEKERRKQVRKQREGELVQQLLVEAERRRRQLKQRAADRAYEEKFQKEMGVEAEQQRVRNYMKKVTIGGKEIVDPTGKTREVHPSTVTTFTDWKFGLGGARDDILHLEQSKYPTVQPDENFLPKTAKPVTPDNSAEARKKTRELAATLNPSMNLNPLNENAASPEFPGLWGQDDGAIEDEKRRAHASKISKLEAKMMEEARKRQKENIVQPQVVWGKEFKGPAFVCKPAAAEYIDFEVGQSYSMTLTLTNVSFTFNSFKLLDQPDILKDFFTIDYKPSGALSAGIATTLKLTFEPKVNQDIDTEIKFLAETGAFSVPVRCRTKKAVLSTLTPEIVYDIVYGEDKTLPLILHNAGALPVEYFVRQMKSETEGLPPPVDPEADPDDEVIIPDIEFTQLDPQIALQLEGTMGGYCKETIDINYTPSSPSTSVVPLLITFDRKEVPPVRVTLRCSASDVPIYLKNDEVDFRTCVVNESYRSSLGVSNRSSTALKAQPLIPQELKGCLEFVPNMGFVQGGETLEFGVKFVPDDKVLSKCSEFMVTKEEQIRKLLEQQRDDDLAAKKAAAEQTKSDGENADATESNGDEAAANSEEGANNDAEDDEPAEVEFDVEDPQWSNIADLVRVPMQVSVPDQAAPVFAMIVARITSSSIQVDMKNLDFGNVIVGESAEIEFWVTNVGALPQRVGLPALPRGLSAEPDNGVVTLVPGERQPIRLKYSPFSAITLSERFRLQSSMAMQCNKVIKVAGKGIMPALELNTTNVRFASCCMGDTVVASVVGKNRTKDPLTFQIMVPEKAGLMIDPVVGTVSPGDTVRIQIDYNPDDDKECKDHFQKFQELLVSSEGQEEDEGNNQSAEGEAADAGQTPAQATGNDAPEQDENAPNKPGADSSAIDDLPAIRSKLLQSSLHEGFNGLEDFSSHTWWRLPLHIKGGNTQHLGLQVTACSPTFLLDGAVRGRDGLCLDFGDVPVGQEVVKAITATSADPDGGEMPLSVSGLDPMGPVGMLRDARPLGADAQSINITFKPRAEARYSEKLRIQSGRNGYTVSITGRGVSPKFKLDPDDSEHDMGDCLAGESTSKSIKIVNTVGFDLRYSVLITETGRCNLNGTSAFDVTPAEATVAAGESQELTFSFSPDDQSPYYSAEVEVIVPNQKQRCILHLRGRGWAQGMYARMPLGAVSEAMTGLLGSGAGKVGGVDRFALPDAEGNLGALRFRCGGKVELPPPPSKETADEESVQVQVGGEASFVIGNCGGKGPGDFAIEVPAEAKDLGFTVDLASAAVDGGQSKDVTVKFTPTKGGGGVGRWVMATLNGVVRKGVPAPSNPDGAKFTVVVQGFLPSDAVMAIAAPSAAADGKKKK